MTTRSHAQAVRAGMTGEAQPVPRCIYCTHPKSDHDGRTDHRKKYSLVVAGEPWCHACNTTCDYTTEAPPVLTAEATDRTTEK